MIVVCAGMSRSGSTLQYQLISELVERLTIGRGYGSWNTGREYPPDSKRFIYVIKSERFIPDLCKKADFIFSTIRNPFDVAVSLYRFRLSKEYYIPTGEPLSMNEIINGELRQVISWVSSWIDENANTVRYEDVFPNNRGLILERATHELGIALDDELKNGILDKYSLVNNVARINKQSIWFDQEHSLLTLGHISPNMGKPGAGKAYLTADQCDMILSIDPDFITDNNYVP